MAWLQSDELPHPYNTSGDVDFNKVAERNEPLIPRRQLDIVEKPDDDALKVDFNAWRARPEIEVWLKEAALFDAICKTPELLGKDWWDWPQDLRTRDVEALEKKRKMSVASIDEFCATQFLFDKQWLAIKAYANSKGIALVGDMPIYVGGHSADVWANQNLFLLGSDCKPTAVAGVPPDAFSEDGQLWGNPCTIGPRMRRRITVGGHLGLVAPSSFTTRCELIISARSLRTIQFLLALLRRKLGSGWSVPERSSSRASR